MEPVENIKINKPTPKVTPEKAKEYSTKFYQKHINDRTVCQICSKSYSPFTKFAHFRSQFHKSAQKIRDELKVNL